MEKYQLFPLPRCLQGRFQPAKFPAKHLLIVLAATFFLVKPSTGAANSIVAVFVAVIVQDPLIFKAIGLAEFIELRRRAPPVVMISLQDDLSAGNRMDPSKIRLRVVQIQCPGPQILGISITTWRKMEQGIMPPRLSSLVVYRAADAFGIPTSTLFSKTP